MAIAAQRQKHQTADDGSSDTGHGKQELESQELSAGDSSIDSQGGEIEDTLSGLRLILLTASLTLAVFMTSLDFTILATAIPKITTEFGSFEDVGWYGSSYLLTTNAFQPTWGKLFALFNVKAVYLTALAIFLVGSIVCAVAQNSVTLIIGRAVQGLGSSAIFAGGATIIGFSAPLKSRATHIGVLSSMFGTAAAVGPVLGGVFTSKATWRWCFWVNLPIGGVAMIAVFAVLRPPKRPDADLPVLRRLREFDLLGTILILGTVICLLLPLQWGGVSLPWSAPKVFGCLIAFGLLLILFSAWQYHIGDKAIVPLRILKNRTVCASSLVSGFLIMATYTHIYYLPFYFQVIKDASPESSGVRSIPYFAILAMSSIAAGAVISLVRTYVEFMWAGCAIMTVGSGLIYTLKVGSSAGEWIGFQVVAGFGVGLALQTPFTAVQRAVKTTDIPLGMAAVIFTNSLGGAISTSTAQNIFSTSLRKNVPKYASGVTNVDEIIHSGGVGVRDMVKEAQLKGLLYAYNLALTDTFIFAIATAGLSLVAALFVKRYRL